MVSKFIPMEESNQENSQQQVLQNVRELVESSVLKQDISIQALTGVNTTDIENIHKTLSDVIEVLKG